MKKHKGPRYDSDYSYLLEEQIEVPYLVLGYPEWLEMAIPGHLKSIQRQIRPGREAQDLVPFLVTLWKTRFKENGAKQVGAIGTDLETSGEKDEDGIDPVSSTSRVILGQIGTSKEIYVVQPELLPFFREPLESNEILKVNQNIEFDYKWYLQKYGIHIVRMYCTMLAEQLLRAGRDGFGVSLLDLVRYHACRLISKAVRNEFFHHTGVFTEQQLYYAARDVFLLFDVFLSQKEEIRDLKLETVARDEFQCIPATAEMELTGVFMDQEILGLSIDYWTREEARLKQQIKTVYNDELTRLGLKSKGDDFFTEIFGMPAAEEEEFDLDSTSQKIDALMKIGVKLKNAQRATLKETKHVLTQLLVEYSVVQKIVSTYGVRLVKMVHPDTGRLHPKFKQLGIGDGESNSSREQKATIATGRFSSDFQQLPRPKEIYEVITDPAEIQTVEAVLGPQLVEARKTMADVLAKEAAEKEKKAA